MAKFKSQKMLLIFITFLVLLQLFGHSDARQLTRDEFDETVGGDYFLFIKYYAPWCGHCRKLSPIWDELETKILAFQTSKVIIAKVDCTEERDLCSRESVIGYPTLKLYKAQDKNGVEYHGERELSSLEAYLRTQLGDAIVDGGRGSESVGDTVDVPKPKNGLYELNDDNFEAFILKGRHFVKFYAPWCGHCQKLAPIWDLLAESFGHDTSVKISKIDCTLSSISCKKFDIKGYPTLLWIVNGKVVDRYKGSRTHEDLKQFVSEKRTQELHDTETQEDTNDAQIMITEQSFYRTISDGITFIKYMVPWCAHSKKLKPIWDQLTTKFFGNKQVKIVKVDCSHQENLCNKQQVDGYPTLLLYKNGDRIGEYNGDNKLEMLYDFVHEHYVVPEKQEL